MTGPEIVGVRAQRLHEMTEADAIAEGILGPVDIGFRAFRVPGDSKPRYSEAVAAFGELWDSINRKAETWESNPWVWAITFKKLETVL